jgi:heat-inducible transcriptional repressor
MLNAINDRDQHLLRLLIEKYIMDGQPVSSKTLAENTDIAYSAATIRNIMAELEERGYLRSLHTSSGRVPTNLGYRYFINTLLTVIPLDETVVNEFKKILHPDQSTNELITSASNLLAELTKMAGLVTVPHMPLTTLRHVEFLPLSNQRVLIILVINEKEVQNRIIQTQHSFTRSELEQAANYLNENFSGMNLEEIRRTLFEKLSEEQADFKQLMHSFINIANQAFQLDGNKNDFVLAGEHHLLINNANADLDQIRQLFNVINQKHQVLHLLDQCLGADEVKIFIGKELGHTFVDEYCVVSAPYCSQGQIIGALGVIGPARMPYGRIIPIVEMSARLLTIAMANHEE